jgi:hypothetical protein
VTLCVLALPHIAYAVPATVGTPNQIETKKAQRDAAVAALQQAQFDLNVKTSEYIEGARELERTRAEVSEVSTQMAALDESITRAETALVQRAIELYRGDRLNLLALLLDSRSVSDFMTRANYLVTINGHDSRMVTGLRQARTESAWLHERLSERVARQEALQLATENARKDLDLRMKQQQAEATALGEDLAELMRRARTFAGSEASGAFDPDTIITDANFRDVGSMTVAEIQTFLERQPGTLDTYRAKDHNGRTSSVAEMIVEAAVAYRISPKVILVTLQKEQSLLEKRNPTQKSYDWAMGCGRADSRTYTQYKGFGKQIWFGAEKLNKNAAPWHAGIERKIDGSVVRMTNEATYSLYKYTPHFHGNQMFWSLYWRYFGSPLESPAG